MSGVAETEVALPGFRVAVVVVVEEVVGEWGVLPKTQDSFRKPPELPCLGLPKLA